jgi:hypothetical protein
MKNRKNRSCIHPVACGGRKKMVRAAHASKYISDNDHNCIIGKRGKKQNHNCTIPKPIMLLMILK